MDFSFRFRFFVWVSVMRDLEMGNCGKVIRFGCVWVKKDFLDRGGSFVLFKVFSFQIART